MTGRMLDGEKEKGTKGERADTKREEKGGGEVYFGGFPGALNLRQQQ